MDVLLKLQNVIFQQYCAYEFIAHLFALLLYNSSYLMLLYCNAQ